MSSVWRTLVVYENEIGGMRSELRAERADPKPKRGERVAFTENVQVTHDPEDTLDEVFDAIGLNVSVNPRSRRIYEAARGALGVDADDDDTEWGDSMGDVWDAGMPERAGHDDRNDFGYDENDMTINVSPVNAFRSLMLAGRR